MAKGNDMMKQIQALQSKMAQAQQSLAETIIEGSSGGGVVQVSISAQPEMQSITIKPEAVDPDDVEMLQDLIMAAINDALEKVRSSQMQQLAGLAGGMNIPGLTS